jgi:peptide/nickel transport system ATP-binding protein
LALIPDDRIGQATPASRGEALLSVRGLTTVFETSRGTIRAVDDVSFDVRRGETLALVGESGCGKSVTAASVMRLVQPPGRVLSGEIVFDGRDLLALREREMQKIRGARISLVFQEPAAALSPVFTIRDQIAEALISHGRPARQARGRATDLLEAVRIPDAGRCASSYPHQLSGGMRQRALIAMALACEPALVIADEPTTALDLTVQAEILDLLREMKAKSALALLLITHDLGVVAEMADRVIVMYAGRLVEQAPVRNLFRAPAHPYTRALISMAARRRDGSRLAAIDGSVPDPCDLPGGCAFNPRCPARLAHCSLVAPDMTRLAQDHHVRCHLHAQGEAATGVLVSSS